MKTLLAIILLTFIALPSEAKHPTHISIVNMEIDADSLKLNYSIRLFQDDLLYLITGLYHKELFHTTDTFDLALNMDKIENYFKNSLEIKTDSLILKPKLIHNKNEETEFWLFYSINLIQLPNTLTIKNSILIDLYSDQTNLLIFSYNKKEKGLTFNSKTISQSIILENL
jgi:hypothetical protein